MTGYDAQTVHTPYDDVFRTLLNDCSKLMIPVLNETFGEHYTGDETILFHQNEHFLDRQDGNAEKRISDSSFTVIGEKRQQYLYECQSTADSSMLVRIFEYATQIAIEQGEILKHILCVKIPRCAVLFLRSTRNTPDQMKIHMETPGGAVGFDVPVTRVQKYSLEELFEKDLLFLIPFYIFKFEDRFWEYNTKEEKRKELEEEYTKIMNYLDERLIDGKINAYIRKTLIEMSVKVLDHIAKKYENIREGVRVIMGGRILEYEAKTILREGIMKQAKETALNLYEMGMKEDFIAKAVNVSVDVVKQWLDLAGI
ncbi:MAG: hypothetical protein Q4F41_17585 [Eubacteriales bacterium]|nr:hypothetical protein [Eubacteriales bacterium]